MPQRLYHSTVPIPSNRRTAAQINPGVARMHQGAGLREIGKAMFSAGLQIHQVNVARQVANAIAQYKMNEANFMFEMMNADPSTTDYNQKWGEFVSDQADLTAGVTRDAGNIIVNKLKMMQASDYKSLKRMEISNTRALVINELPGVMDNLMREQVQAEMDGDFDRAEQAKQNMVEYLQGVAPALRPGEGGKMVRMYDAGLDSARQKEEAQRFTAEVLKDPVKAEAMLGSLKYQTPSQLLSLRTTARRQQGVKTRMGTIQKNAYLDQQSGVLLKQYLNDETLMLTEDLAPELQGTVDAINNSESITNVGRDELSPTYYAFKENINSMIPISDTKLLDAATVIPKTQIRELQKANAENTRLRPRKKEAQMVFAHVNKMFDKLITTAITMQFKETDTSTVLMQELSEEKDVVLQEVRQRLLNGDTRVEIMQDLNNLFKATREGVLENRFMRKIKTGANEFYAEIEKSEDERFRLHKIMNLLMTKGYTRQIEAAVESGWFSE
jgi:hypothetical protein